jgi:hypothetical protein
VPFGESFGELTRLCKSGALKKLEKKTIFKKTISPKTERRLCRYSPLVIINAFLMKKPIFALDVLEQ